MQRLALEQDAVREALDGKTIRGHLRPQPLD